MTIRTTEKKFNVKKLVIASILSALVVLATAFIAFPTGHGGYLNLGDGVVLASAYLLGPWGMAVAAIGSGLADVLGGYFIYAPATAVIKAAMAGVAWLFFRSEQKKYAWLRLGVGIVLAEGIMVLGYFGFECAVLGWTAASAAVLPNLFQAGGGVMVSTLLLGMARRMGWKNQIG